MDLSGGTDSTIGERSREIDESLLIFEKGDILTTINKAELVLTYASGGISGLGFARAVRGRTPRTSRASRAAFCSASFLERPSPEPCRRPLTITSTEKVRA